MYWRVSERGERNENGENGEKQRTEITGEAKIWAQSKMWTLQTTKRCKKGTNCSRPAHLLVPKKILFIVKENVD